jgi:uncharacterized circularly permuted ATP-grasp superfamily protein
VLGVPPAMPFDETELDPDAYAAIRAQLTAGDLEEVHADIQQQLHLEEVRFGGVDGGPFVVDLVPRIISASEWSSIAAGLRQRVRALEAFVADVYDAQAIVAAGVVPVSVIETASYYEPILRGLEVGTWISLAGLDLVRDADGELRVLEDNLRTPSGLAYALAARRVVSGRVGVPADRELAPLDGGIELIARALVAAAPPGVEDPFCVLLTDGERNSAHHEHRVLAQLLEIPLLTPELLERRGEEIFTRIDGRRRRVDVLYRRTDADRLAGRDGELTSLGELLMTPWCAGRLGVVNAFGTGVADDKRTHAYVEDAVRFYLGEEPLLRSVPTLDLSDPSVRASALDRLAELVIKPRDGHGGHGVVIGPAASPQELSRLRVEITADPGRFVAQELVCLSSHPTLCDGELVPRHIDLRPFVVSGGGEIEVIPGGLSRVALQEGSTIVNSSQNGGAKDTWILS